jgi:hypothetical protein
MKSQLGEERKKEMNGEATPKWGSEFFFYPKTIFTFFFSFENARMQSNPHILPIKTYVASILK